MAVRTKSIYEPGAKDDGMRVLVTNYWPRGISRERAGTYIRKLAPSRDLMRAFKDGSIEWRKFQPRYLKEMRGEEQRAEIERLAQVASTENETLMCACRDDAHCHRRLLQRLIETRMNRQRG